MRGSAFQEESSRVVLEMGLCQFSNVFNLLLTFMPISQVKDVRWKRDIHPQA